MKYTNKQIDKKIAELEKKRDKAMRDWEAAHKQGGIAGALRKKLAHKRALEASGEIEAWQARKSSRQ